MLLPAHIKETPQLIRKPMYRSPKWEQKKKRESFYFLEELGRAGVLQLTNQPGGFQTRNLELLHERRRIVDGAQRGEDDGRARAQPGGDSDGNSDW